MTLANEPLQPTTNNRSHKTSASGSKQPTVTSYKPMSRLPLSAELEEYTKSMHTYLASVENRPSDHRRPSDSSEDSEPDQASTEFCWMDLGALQRKYSNQSVSVEGTHRAKSMHHSQRSHSSLSPSPSPSSVVKPSHRNNGARQHVTFDSRYQCQRPHKMQHLENRPASPSRISSSSMPIRNIQHSPLQPRVRVKVSTEKN